MSRSEASKIGVAVAALVIAAGIWLLIGGGGDEERTVYFYDVSEKTLYEAPHNAFAPLEGIGGEAGDGVEAIVVCCPECGAERQRIAYLKTHTAEFKRKRDEASRSGTRIEGLTRQWIAENTLVRFITGEEWHVAASPDGVNVVSSWKQRCAEHGRWEKPCMP